MKYIAYFFLLIYVFFGGYLMMMPILRAFKEHKMTNEEWMMCGPWVVIFLITDALFNWTIACLIFVDFPREILTTQRLERYVDLKYNTQFLRTYRIAVARFVCTRLLDRFDPDGKHCK